MKASSEGAQGSGRGSVYKQLQPLGLPGFRIDSRYKVASLSSGLLNFPSHETALWKISSKIFKMSVYWMWRAGWINWIGFGIRPPAECQTRGSCFSVVRPAWKLHWNILPNKSTSPCLNTDPLVSPDCNWFTDSVYLALRHPRRNHLHCNHCSLWMRYGNREHRGCQKVGTTWKVAPLPSQSGLSPGTEETEEKYSNKKYIYYLILFTWYSILVASWDVRVIRVSKPLASINLELASEQLHSEKSTQDACKHQKLNLADFPSPTGWKLVKECERFKTSKSFLLHDLVQLFALTEAFCSVHIISSHSKSKDEDNDEGNTRNVKMHCWSWTWLQLQMRKQYQNILISSYIVILDESETKCSGNG